MTPKEGQNLMDEWLNKLPVEIENFYSFLSENVKKFQTFDLLSFISYYNHLHDVSETYSDFREGRNFYASEVLALLCLKNDFVNESIVPHDDFLELAMEIQETVLSYCGRNDALEMKRKPVRQSTVSNIADILTREAKYIRNPGLPDHHLIFTEKLFEPIKNEIKSLIGFSISDSVTIRKLLPTLINKKCTKAIYESKGKAEKHIDEIINYRKTKTVVENSRLSKDQLEEYSLLPDEEIKQGIEWFFLNELYYTFSKIYTFTEAELADFTKVELQSVKAFLKQFSCVFPSLNQEDKIYEPITVLKTKPIIEHNGQYLIPSYSLLTWAVEDVVETGIKENRKLSEKYPNIKHDFLLTQGLEFFKRLLPTATFYPPNLFYTVNNENCETDALIIYDKVLFIVEAKGHRITPKAKGGNEVRTEKHLKNIIEDSYSQGIRTLKYIKEYTNAEFKPKNGKRIEISKNDFDDIIIVSLTLEPVGNLSMAIKTTNEIGFFSDGHFPLIISLYDLVVIADLFENPIMFIHYIKRRKAFLSSKLLSIYEELDLVAYFLHNGLYIANTLKDAEANKVSWIEYLPDTDAINDYYWYKFGHKEQFTEKPKCYISNELNNFLLQLDSSKLQHRVKMALLLLEFDSKSLNQLMDYIQKTKIAFAEDKSLHDCSTYTEVHNGIGITFMTCVNKEQLDFELHFFCKYKMNKQNSNIWVGFGDISTEPSIFNFQSMFFAMRKDLQLS